MFFVHAHSNSPLEKKPSLFIEVECSSNGNLPLDNFILVSGQTGPLKVKAMSVASNRLMVFVFCKSPVKHYLSTLNRTTKQ